MSNYVKKRNVILLWIFFETTAENSNKKLQTGDTKKILNLSCTLLSLIFFCTDACHNNNKNKNHLFPRLYTIFVCKFAKPRRKAQVRQTFVLSKFILQFQVLFRGDVVCCPVSTDIANFSIFASVEWPPVLVGYASRTSQGRKCIPARSLQKYFM